MSLPSTLSSLWQQQDLSDVDVALLVEGQAVHSAFPAHSVALSNSPVFRAQCLRWHSNSSQAYSCSLNKGNSSNIDADSRQRVIIQLQDEQQVPAAMAVLAALYGVKTIPELLSELTQEQQLHSAILADMWQIDAVSTAAAHLLMNAAQSSARATGSGLSAALSALMRSGSSVSADDFSGALSALITSEDLLESSDGLSAAVSVQLLSMATYPDCLLPLVRVVLLSRLGDVEAVWGDAELQNLLLGLPLAAMEVLLASDELKATSEDNTLYTAQRYVENISDPQQQQAAKQVLAPLIRCPFLSPFWLSASVLSDDAPRMLLNQLSKHVTKLIMAQHARPGQHLFGVLKLLPEAGVPASWALGARGGKCPSSVQLTWALDVSEIRQAAQDSARQQKLVRLYSPSVSSPLGGIVWSLGLEARWDEDEKASQISFFFVPKNVPAGMFLQYACNLSVRGFFGLNRTMHMPLHSYDPRSGYGENRYWGWRDAFGLGSLPSGWDEAAWAAKGLPTTGQLLVTLAVQSVGHTAADLQS